MLRIYGQLTDLIDKRDVSEARAAERIAQELLDCWYSSSVVKRAAAPERGLLQLGNLLPAAIGYGSVMRHPARLQTGIAG